MERRKGSGAIKIRVPEEMIDEMELAVQYLRLTGQGPQTLSGLLMMTFKEWLDRHPQIKKYIEANLSIIEKVRSETAQGGGS